VKAHYLHFLVHGNEVHKGRDQKHTEAMQTELLIMALSEIENRKTFSMLAKGLSAKTNMVEGRPVNAHLTLTAEDINELVWRVHGERNSNYDQHVHEVSGAAVFDRVQRLLSCVIEQVAKGLTRGHPDPLV
jgi:hypothetical protein